MLNISIQIIWKKEEGETKTKIGIENRVKKIRRHLENNYFLFRPLKQYVRQCAANMAAPHLFKMPTLLPLLDIIEVQIRQKH
jgi:hypothetical protein